MVERKLFGELSQCHLFYQFYDLIYISIDIRLIGKMDTMQKSFTNKFIFFCFSSFILSLWLLCNNIMWEKYFLTKIKVLRILIKKDFLLING